MRTVAKTDQKQKSIDWEKKLIFFEDGIVYRATVLYLAFFFFTSFSFFFKSSLKCKPKFHLFYQ